MRRQRSSIRAEAGPVLRGAVRIITSPVLSLGLIGTLIFGLSLFSSGSLAFFGAFLLPFVALLLAVLALPTLGALRHRYRLPEQTRRNHALEHGTIHFLRQHYGKRYKLSGKSEERGFRVAGARTAADIQKAFRDLMTELRTGNHAIVVQRGCGSNIATAQACGLILMAGLSIVVVAYSLSSLMVLLGVVIIICVVMLVRYPLGMSLQRRRFVLVDFSDASILSIDPVDRADLFERHPVHFVRTQVYRA